MISSNKLTLIISAICLILLAILALDSLNLPTFTDEISFLLNVKYFAQHKTLTPLYVHYPSLFSYIISIPVYLSFLIFYLIKGFSLQGLTDVAFLKFLYYENLIIWNSVSRLVTMMFSIATLVLILKRAAQKYGSIAFFVAASLLALDPFGIYRSFPAWSSGYYDDVLRNSSYDVMFRLSGKQ